MLDIVIDWIYYKDGSWFRKFNARLKKDCVYFYDYDKYVGCLIDSLSYSELQKLRLNIYNYVHKYIKFTMFKEDDLNWGFFEGYKIHSDIIELDNHELALLLPNAKLRKKFFDYNDIKEKYYFKWDFINHCNFHVI